jgi:hypothetical protein
MIDERLIAAPSAFERLIEPHRADGANWRSASRLEGGACRRNEAPSTVSSVLIIEAELTLRVGLDNTPTFSFPTEY